MAFGAPIYTFLLDIYLRENLYMGYAYVQLQKILPNCVPNRHVTIYPPSSGIWEFQLFLVPATVGFVGHLDFTYSGVCVVVINCGFNFHFCND